MEATTQAAMLAEQLNGMEYPLRIPAPIVKAAKAEGLVIVYGASDDLMELEGAITDEFGCSDGGVALIDREGLIPEWEQSNESEKDAANYFRRKPKGVPIESLWCKEEGYSWTYTTDLPHATFEVVEDGAPYCRGLVFSIESLPA